MAAGRTIIPSTAAAPRMIKPASKLVDISTRRREAECEKMRTHLVHLIEVYQEMRADIGLPPDRSVIVLERFGGSRIRGRAAARNSSVPQRAAASPRRP